MRPYDGIWTVVALVAWLVLALAFEWPNFLVVAGVVAVIYTWRWRIPD